MFDTPGLRIGLPLALLRHGLRFGLELDLDLRLLGEELRVVKIRRSAFRTLMNRWNFRFTIACIF